MIENKVAFCIVNDITTYANEEIKTTIQNILDFTISNLYIKGYKTFVGIDEDILLQSVSSYEYAVVMSPGTEYINGYNFFIELENLLKKDFFLAGHILDRSEHDAYYELHHQCYVINLTYYKKIGCPIVGKLEYNNPHEQTVPLRSLENWHDNHTPKFVSKGNSIRRYKNRCHGWNLLRLAFENNLPIIVFDESIRNNKKHYYPESEKDYYKHSEFIEHKFNFCKNEFVHKDNTEWANQIYETYNQLVIPASGTLYLNLIDHGYVIFYDYNERALNYWKEHCPCKESIEYQFVKTDLLNDTILVDHIKPNLKTLVNFSNIFCYEGTAAKYSLNHRLTAQNRLVSAINDKVKIVDINFTIRADDGHR